MRRAKILPKAMLFLVAIGLAIAVDTLPQNAFAQDDYECPPGYYWDPDYGCLPVGYFYGPPYYVYPDLGFGFFYPGVPRGYPHGRGPRGAAPRGRAPEFRGGGRGRQRP